MLRSSLIALMLLSFSACGPAAEPESDASQAAALAQFRALDMTEDGFLSGSEAKDFTQYDRNNDGRIEQSEFLAQAGGGQVRGLGGEAAFDRLDANEDGKLSGTEAVDFKQLDQDGDGRITRAEFLAGQAATNPDHAAGEVARPKTPKRPPTAWDQKLAGQFDGGKKWAVLVGVNRYAESPLRYCVSDSKLLADALVKHAGYARENILLLTDDQADAQLHPNKSALQQRIPELLKKVGDKDTVLVAFAGHGFSADGQSFLCPLDYDAKQSKLSGWRADELRSMLHDCRAAQKVLVLDCCHSGGAVLLGGGSGGQVQSAAFEHAQGLITFASCKPNETSLESAERGQGVFTFALVQALRGEGDFDGNNIVDSDELYRHLLLEVPKLAEEVEAGHKQTPVRIIGQDVVGVFALARPDAQLVAADRAAAARAKAQEEAAKPKPGDRLINSIGMRLVMLPNLLFAMGSPPDEYQRNDDERLNPIILPKPIYCGVYEVTQAEFERVMGSNPSYFSAEGAGASAVAGMPTGRFPVEQVSWGDAVAFCEKLSELPAEKAARRIYRLPTEAEWEYACRAGTVTAFASGELISAAQANIRGDRPYWNAPPGPYLGRPRTVGAYDPNKFGLYDMHGNVAEWCQNRYVAAIASNFAPTNPVESSDEVAAMLGEFAAWCQKYAAAAAVHVDPQGPARGTTRVLRGGSYTGDVTFCRSAARRDQEPEYRYRTNGFRVVCEIAPPPMP